MKVIFIDVDGVFNSCDDMNIYTMPAPHQYYPHIVDMNKVAMFNFVVERLNEFEPFRVVVSSAWRNVFHRSEEFSVITGIANELIHDDWRTEFIGRSADRVRHLEVDKWLNEHPDTLAWITFDDLPFDFPEANFIKTQGLLGLEFEHLEEMCRRFGYKLDYAPERPYFMDDAPTEWVKFRNGWKVTKQEDVPVA